MKIRYKVIASIYIMLIMMIVMLITTYSALLSVDNSRKHFEFMQKQLLATTDVRARVRDYLLETYEIGFVLDKTEMHTLEIPKAKVLKAFQKLELSVKGSDDFHDIYILHKEFLKLDLSLNQVLVLLKNGDVVEGQRALLHAREVKFNKGFITKITAFIETQNNLTQQTSMELETSIQILQRKLVFFAVLTLLLVGGLLFFVSKSIGVRLKRLEKATKKISEGNFEITLQEHGSDEIFVLSRAFNLMASSLQEAKSKLIKQQEAISHSSKMSALGEMAGSIAHEINTPLAAIILNAEMIEMQNSEKEIPDESITKRSKAIMQISQRIAKIISGLKGFSRDARADSKEIFTIRELLSTTIEMCSEKFKNNGIDLHIDKENLEMEVCGQIIQLSQTVLNLLSNSFDAIQGLDEKWIRIKIVQRGSSLDINVIDSGRGLDPKVLEKIFQPFFTTKEIGKGTGLGLSISQNIVKQNDGELFYDDSNPNTCFVITLPLLHHQAVA